MLKAVVVDDEKLSASLLAKNLASTDNVIVEKELSDPRQAIDTILQLSPDMVFLDIEMPQISGLEIAEQISSIDANIEIIFITAYSKYALEAFNANNIDYILKPIPMLELERVISKVINKITAQNKEEEKLKSQKQLQIKALGSLCVSTSDSTEHLKFCTPKSKELLAYLIYNQKHHAITLNELIEQLWQKSEDNKSVINLRCTVCSLNKTLNEYNAAAKVTMQNDEYKFECESLYTDTENLVNELEHINSTKFVNDIDLQKIKSLYCGEFLSDINSEWARELKKYYLNIFLMIVKSVTEKHLTANINIQECFYLIEYAMGFTPYNTDLRDIAVKCILILKGKKTAADYLKEFKKLNNKNTTAIKILIKIWSKTE